MSWTDDRVDLLTKLWGEGKTAAEIAKELGGVTRNAVIGKAHRLKLSNRVSPIQQNKKPAPVKVSKPAPVQERKAKKVEVDMSDRDLVSLTDLKANQCRWPSGDPQEENFGFCGDHALAGLPYCLEHSKVAYQAATRNRILKTHGDKEIETVTPEEMKAAKKALAK